MQTQYKYKNIYTKICITISKCIYASMHTFRYIYVHRHKFIYHMHTLRSTFVGKHMCMCICDNNDILLRLGFETTEFLLIIQKTTQFYARPQLGNFVDIQIKAKLNALHGSWTPNLSLNTACISIRPRQH